MNPETADALTRLIDAVSNLVTTLGSGWTGVLVIFVTLVAFGVPAWREHKRNKRADIVVSHKEKEVERLAEDNRRYREVYLERLGVASGILSTDRADSEAATAEREGSRS